MCIPPFLPEIEVRPAPRWREVRTPFDYAQDRLSGLCFGRSLIVGCVRAYVNANLTNGAECLTKPNWAFGPRLVYSALSALGRGCLSKLDHQLRRFWTSAR